METQSKKKILNTLMVILVIAIALCCFMAVRTLRSSTRASEEQTAAQEQIETKETETETAAIKDNQEVKEEFTQEAAPAQSEKKSSGEQKSAGDTKPKAGSSEVQNKVNTCTISISCKSILKNMDDLATGKEAYVPPNGVILATSKVEFKEGDTVHDVLRAVCKAAGIQMETTGSYVEGINHLYEFDCGSQSGWKYEVNGSEPNYGANKYKLKNGDSIVWRYTCG